MNMCMVKSGFMGFGKFLFYVGEAILAVSLIILIVGLVCWGIQYLFKLLPKSKREGLFKPIYKERLESILIWFIFSFLILTILMVVYCFARDYYMANCGAK